MLKDKYQAAKSILNTTIMNLHVYSFEKLETWQKAKELAKAIYDVTEHFPDREKFGLTQQMRRCAISIASNIAEGSARKTSKDKAHFTTIAYGSLMELLNQIIIAYELHYILETDYQNIRSQVQKVSYMLNALRNSQTPPP